jgi:ABC-type glycerol-3-phosphate transport system permease component
MGGSSEPRSKRVTATGEPCRRARGFRARAPVSPRLAELARVSRRLARAILLLPVLAYTAFSAGPYIWTAMMSLRTTEEIYRSHYGLPIPAHWLKYATAWNEFGYATYFKNSTIVAVASVLIVTVIGSMAGFAFARRRYHFPLREPLFLLIFLSIMFPPQIMLLSLFQILVQYRLFNSLTGLTLVYVVTELPLTIYLLRAFFAQIPTELEEAARIDGCNDWAMFWRVMFPMALPAVATTVILNFIYFWNEFLYAVVFITQQKIRTLPLAIQFLVSDQYQDIGMLATGLMIATLPVLILYLFLSEWFVKGMTAGAIKG